MYFSLFFLSSCLFIPSPLENDERDTRSASLIVLPQNGIIYHEQ